MWFWRFYCGGDWRQGAWCIAFMGYGLSIKAPWAHKYYSERYGYVPYFPRNGWRVSVLTGSKS